MSTKDSNPRLGRGLAALMGDASVSPAPLSGGTVALAIDLLSPGPFQPRGSIDPESLRDLISSIRSNGILQPILVRRHPTEDNRYQIIAGERRWRAAQAAGLHEIPVLLRDLSDAEAMPAALVENLQRQDLNPIEEAEGYRKLMHEFAMTQERLAEAVGKSRSHLANTVRLLSLPESVLGEVRSGKLSAGHARALLSHPEPEKGARAVIAGALNVRQTEALATSASRPDGPSRSTAKPVDPETSALQQELSHRLGLRIEIGFNGKGGVVRIHYQSLDQLDGVISLLTPI